MSVIMEIEGDMIEEAVDIGESHAQLHDLSIDLVSMRSHEDFLQRLFTQKSGDWANLVLLCRGLPKIERRLHQLQEEQIAPLFVTWLAHPLSEETDNYCTVVFFSSDLLWSNVVVYNRDRLPTSLHLHTRNGQL